MQRFILFKCQKNMKRIIILLLSFAFLVSCKKDQTSKFNTQFSGKWEYATFVGYPFNFPSLPPGNGKIIVLYQNGSFERFTHDTLIFRGKYFLEEKTDCYQNQKQVFFRTDDTSFANDKLIQMKGDSLFFSTPGCYADGGTSIYRKLTN
jgi:hypothetical protein